MDLQRTLTAEHRSPHALRDQEVLTAETSVVGGLVSELWRAWAGIDALSKIIASRCGGGEPASILARLLEAACLSRPDVSGTLFKVAEDRLVSLASFGEGAESEEPRALALSRLRDGRTRIMNSDVSEYGSHHLLAAIAERSVERAVVVFSSPSEAVAFDSQMARIAEALALQAALVLEDDTLRRRLVQEERMSADLEAARRIQSTLLETPQAGSNGLLSWASLSRPSQVVGGDFFDVHAHATEGVDVVIGDVMGKGLPAALLGAACLNHVLRATTDARNLDRLGLILTHANRTLTPELQRLGHFVSATMLRIESDPLRAVLVDAGHGNVVVRSFDGSVFQPRGRETLLGVEQGEFREFEFALSPGDMIFLFTDGLTDMARRRGANFDVVQWLSRSDAVTAADIIFDVAREVAKFCPADDVPDDDITCVAVGVAGW